MGEGLLPSADFSLWVFWTRGENQTAQMEVCATKPNPAEWRLRRAVRRIPRRPEENCTAARSQGRPTRIPRTPDFAEERRDRRWPERKSVPVPAGIRGSDGVCEKA